MERSPSKATFLRTVARLGMQAAEALARIGRDPSTRAEALAPEEFLALTNALE